MNHRGIVVTIKVSTYKDCEFKPHRGQDERANKRCRGVRNETAQSGKEVTAWWKRVRGQGKAKGERKTSQRPKGNGVVTTQKGNRSAR